ncbi:alpha/beta hydrolase [Halobacillus sp. ACCC02827]|uniref:alpha/beta fold hydrolase n=1 Tax=Halobacillus sp. ACCC02827 TaxID=3052090 RepID=UPI0025709F24|nr:alpha/beta fold hydrolase [Halobacillus sp. ACCC02827]WJE16110.1 alpha/beta hydrolase [Halobacillus sp. ACCC02827]
MTLQMKNWKWLYIALGSIFVGLLILMINSKSSSSEPYPREEVTPTLFIHGFKGGPRSFQTMMDRMQSMNWGKKRMTVYVANDGTLSIQGSFPQTKNPFVQILFEDNRASISNQTKWVENVMIQLHSRYNVQQVNIIGHSMGGLASINYLLNEPADGVPAVKKVAAIASPFKGIRKDSYFESNYGAATVDLRPDSDALQDMVKNKDHFSDNVDVLAVAGIINKEAPEQEHWDGLVHASSVHGLEDIVPFGRYYEERIYQPQATHSGLHELAEVDTIVAEFLWETAPMRSTSGEHP